MSIRSTFETQGYVAIPDLLSATELANARAAISDLIEETAFSERSELRGYAGKSLSFCSLDSDFFVQFEPGYEPSEDRKEELELHVRKLMNYDREHPALECIAYGHSRLQPILEELIGPAPEMFQSMALIKPPFIGSEKPWHQDNAYFNVTPLDAVVGVWIALDDATVENGCMHVIPGGHRLGALKHHHDKDCEILQDRLDPADAIPVELPAGGALLFYGMLPHQTPPNRSPDRRRALQYHYHAASAVRIPTESYDQVFAERDGTPASCEAARLAGI